MNDDRLHLRLAAADPAADLAPLPGLRSAALLDRAAQGSPAPRRRRAPALLGGLAAAAAVTTAVVLLVPRPAAPVLTLTLAPTDLTAICAPVADAAPAALRGSDIAFAGTIASAGDDRVVVRPDRFFRGGPAAEVRVRVEGGGGAALDGAVLRVGERVLVAAADGVVAPCGVSAAESPALLRIYERAAD